jgi:NADP-dependent 3-hydroxy acid dehydrogenase YdfG
MGQPVRRKLKDMLFVVTGPTRGIGKAVLEALSTQPHSIVCVGRGLDRVRDLPKNERCQIKYVNLDFQWSITEAQAGIDELRKIAEKHRGPIVLISNAGAIEPIGKAHSLELEDLNQSMKTNFTIPTMIANSLAGLTTTIHSRLLVLNVTSGAAKTAVPGLQPYCAAKAAKRMALDVLCMENPTVSAVHFDPGVVDTDMQSKIRKVDAKDMPSVNDFEVIKSTGGLRVPADIAMEIIQLVRNWSK